MEHRLCKRKTIHLPARLQVHQQDCGTAHVSNLSAGGAFIQLEDPSRCGIDQMVKISLPLPTSNGQDSTLQLSAIIVHRNSKGIGIMFLSEEENLRQSLQKIAGACAMNKQQPSPPKAPLNNIVPIKPKGPRLRLSIHPPKKQISTH